MSPCPYDLNDLNDIQAIISDAARQSLGIYYTRSTADFKADGSIVTEADLAMQQALTEQLHKRFPLVQMLGEEVDADTQRAVIDSGEDFWCLDPVDGTTNFHATLPLFSVSLGLVRDGEIVLGVVYDPNRQEFFAALRGEGLWVDGRRLQRPEQPDRLGNCIAFVDFKRVDGALGCSLVQDTPYKSQRNIGTCALEWAWLATGRVNLLLHGSEKLWDYAAGLLLAEESGCRAETLDGEAIFNHSLEPRSVVAASTPALFERWATRLRNFD